MGRLVMVRILLLILIIFSWVLAFVGPPLFSARMRSTASPSATPSASSSPAIVLAECLASNGYVLYTAWWCSYCKKQRDAFGPEAYAMLKVIECSPRGERGMSDACRARGVTGYPTWGRPDGVLESGYFPLEALSLNTRCPYAP